MRKKVASILLSVALAFVANGQAIVDLGYSKYEGLLNYQTGNIEFLGVRYAAPPTGNLRWREPQYPQPTENLQQASVQPPRCRQAPEQVDKSGNDLANDAVSGGPNAAQTIFSATLRHRPVSEDCLFLNVVIPGLDFNRTSREKKPVIVWIHGGGYALGSASWVGLPSMKGYDGNDLVRASGGEVIAVTIQYRLGLFGFLAGSDLKRDGVLNAGLRDQQFALQWIQEHISKFGGDPTRVTIWGQSAGGGSVIQHLVANGGKTSPPLFKSAMLSSAFLPPQYPYDHHIPEIQYREVIEGAGCDGTINPLHCLRKVDVQTLDEVSANIAQKALFGTFAFVPVVDGEFMQESPTRAFRTGKLNSNRLLAMVNTFEGRMFVDPQTRHTTIVQKYLPKLFPGLRGKEIRTAAKHYEGLGSPFHQTSQIMGEAIFTCPTFLALRAAMMRSSGKSYKGTFAVPPGGHIDDVLYYFPSVTKSRAPPFNNSVFITTFSGAFLDFVRHSDPNIKSSADSILPHWPTWSSQNMAELVFNRTGDDPDIRETSSSQDLIERCEFWESVAASTGQ